MSETVDPRQLSLPMALEYLEVLRARRLEKEKEEAAAIAAGTLCPCHQDEDDGGLHCPHADEDDCDAGCRVEGHLSGALTCRYCSYRSCWLW